MNNQIKNDRFLNRTITLKQAILEGIAFTALIATFVLACAIA